MIDRIRQAEIFIQVVDSGNFTLAAAALNIPRSTISTVIQHLENRLGTQLFYRTTRQINLTHDGLRYLVAARELIETFEETESLFSHHKHPITGHLHIDLPTRIGTQIVLPQLDTFIKEYPGIHLTLSMSDKWVDLHSEGVDCALRVGILPSSRLVCRKLGELEIINCASPSYLAQYGIPKSLSDLTGHYIVNYAVQRPTATGIWEYFHHKKNYQHPMKSLITVDNAEAYLSAAVSHLGIIQVPAYDVKTLLQQGKLRAIMSAYRPSPMPISLLYTQRRNLPQRIKLFQDWLASLFTEIDGVIPASPS